MGLTNAQAIDPLKAYKIKEVKDFLSVSQGHAYSLCHEGKLKSFDVGHKNSRSFRVLGKHIIEYMNLSENDYLLMADKKLPKEELLKELLG